MRPHGFVLCLLLLAVVAPTTAAELRVSVQGIEGEMHDTVRSRLSLVSEQGHPLLTPERIKLLNARAPREIREALQPFGYYNVRVSADLSRQEGVWQATYVVTPGAPVTIDQVDLAIRGEGADDEAFVDWRNRFPLQAGEVLRHAPYEEAKAELLRIARNRGYFDALLREHRIAVDPNRNRAAVTLLLDSGPRYQFGTVSFPEAIPLRESLLERYRPFEPGDPFDSDLLLALQRRLADSDYFERVIVEPRPEAAREQRVPVEVDAEMQERTRYTLGLGYGTDTGPRTTVGVERRWVNTRGHRFGSELTVSEILTEATFRYRIPLDEPSTDFLGFTGDWTDEETDTTSRETSLVGVSMTHLTGGWLRTLALNYEEESFQVASTDERSRMLVPGIGFQRVVASDRLLPRHGWRLALSLKGASEAMLSSTDMLQGLLRFKHVTTANGGRLITRVQAGATKTSDFSQLPVSLRFFAGGDESVRGYPYQSLGPLENGQVVGGKHLLVGSVEYDYFWGNWGAAVFVDQGNAFNSTSDFELAQGTGFGVRYKLPFGLIRADLARAITDPERSWRLHLTIGPEL